MNDRGLTILYFSSWAASLEIFCAILPHCFSSTYIFVANAFLGTVIAYYLYPFFKRKYFNSKVLPRNKAVIITGCDHGFGHELAKRLDSRGFTVFASCLDPNSDGAKSLKAKSSNSLHILNLNVTDAESIKSAVDYVKSNLGSSELWAVVNNAGIFKGFDVALTPVTDFADCLNVNAIGQVRVSKAFLPLLIASKGRFVNITSIAAKMCFPHSPAYNVSKHAARAFCEVFRQEIRPWGVKLIEIEPEGFATSLIDIPLNKRIYDRLVNGLDMELQKFMDKGYLKRNGEPFIDVMGFMLSSRVHKVIDDLEDAVCSLEPCRVYKPRRNVLASVVMLTCEVMPTPLLQAAVRVFKVFNGFATLENDDN